MKFHNIIIQARDYYRTLSQKKEVRTIMSGSKQSKNGY